MNSSSYDGDYAFTQKGSKLSWSDRFRNRFFHTTLLLWIGYLAVVIAKNTQMGKSRSDMAADGKFNGGEVPSARSFLYLAELSTVIGSGSVVFVLGVHFINWTALTSYATLTLLLPNLLMDTFAFGMSIKMFVQPRTDGLDSKIQSVAIINMVGLALLAKIATVTYTSLPTYSGFAHKSNPRSATRGKQVAVAAALISLFLALIRLVLAGSFKDEVLDNKTNPGGGTYNRFSGGAFDRTLVAGTLSLAFTGIALLHASQFSALSAQITLAVASFTSSFHTWSAIYGLATLLVGARVTELDGRHNAMSTFSIIQCVVHIALAVAISRYTNGFASISKPLTSWRFSSLRAYPRALIGAGLFLLVTLYTIRTGITSDGLNDMFDGKMNMAKTNKATGDVLGFTLRTAAFGYAACAAIALHLIKWHRGTQLTAIAVTLFALSFDLLVTGYAFKQWELGSIASKWSSLGVLAIIQVVAVVAVLFKLIFADSNLNTITANDGASFASLSDEESSTAIESTTTTDDDESYYY